MATKTATKQGLSFDPGTAIEQNRIVQNIGKNVCIQLSNKFKPKLGFDFSRVEQYPFGKKEMHIYHDCTWWTVPLNIFLQGTDAIVEYLSKEYEKQIEERRLAKEKEETERLAAERKRDIEEYKRLKEKLYGNKD